MHRKKLKEESNLLSLEIYIKNLILNSKAIACIFLLLLNVSGYCQDAETDSLLHEVAKGKDDSLKVNALISLAISNSQSTSDKGLEFADSARNLAFKIGFKSGQAYAYKWLAIINMNKGNYYEALINSNKSLVIFQELGDKTGSSNILNNLGVFYSDKGEDSKAVEYYLQALDYAQQSGNKLRIETTLVNIGVIYSKNDATIDTALAYYLRALPYALEIKENESIGIIYSNIGEVYAAKNDFKNADYYYKQSLDILGNSLSTANTYNDLGKLSIKRKAYDSAGIYFDKAYAVAKQNDSPIDILQALISKAKLMAVIGKTNDAITFFNQALEIGKPLESTPELKQVYEGLSAEYKKINDYKNAFAYQNLLNETYQSENEKKLSFNTATLEYAMELQKQSGQIAVLIKQNETQELKLAKEKLTRNVLIGGLAIVLIFVIALLVNTNQRKKLNRILLRQKREIEVQKSSVEKALNDLKSTQSQLIHSEKMASLGELTAGVAHEIQNPLNFVNNFSEVNKEMLEELKTERMKPKDERDDKLQDEIINSVINNELKINHHGKRADAIVKGMLQHARKNTGQKEITDINALTNEYLRLNYHGMKVKDKSFDAELKTDFDPAVKRINIVPQDIGMVLINLFNNSFYAVSKKKKALGDSFKPMVSVQTKKVDGKTQIKVSDNGNGIPQKILDKIFQPFFTTKPSGEGTGLGLSLSYDIIKGHGGEITVDTKEGEGTTFIILLP